MCVLSVYSSHLGVPTTLHSYEDVQLLNMAERMGLPYTAGIVEFDWLKSRTKFVSSMSIHQSVCHISCMHMSNTLLYYAMGFVITWGQHYHTHM